MARLASHRFVAWAAVAAPLAAGWAAAAEPSGGGRTGPGPARAAGRGVDPADRPAVRRLFDSWKLPVPPRRLVGNVYYVGAAGVSAFLVATPDGHVLLDTGFADTVPLVRRGIEGLGFRVADVRYILASHAHVDHVGGHAAMKRLTGATVVASAADAKLLAAGGAGDFSPFPKDMMAYEPVTADRVVGDGDGVTVGGTTLTARLTPGHTKGATTWTTEVTEGGRRLAVVFFSSVGIVEGTRLVGNPDYPGIADDYRRTFATLGALPCDVFLAPHGGQFAMAEKFARLDRDPAAAANPFVDPAGWRKVVGEAEKAFVDQLAAEEKAAGGGRRRPE